MRGRYEIDGLCSTCGQELVKGKIRYDGRFFCRKANCLEIYKGELRESLGEGEEETKG